MKGEVKSERVILVGVRFKDQRKDEFEDLMRELKCLTESAGGKVVGVVTQERDEPDTKFFIGTGKVEELKKIIKWTEGNLLIFNSPLKPYQQRNLEEELGVRVIDRILIILDIFAQRAKSNEGKIQVELAQLKYMLPRLTGIGKELSRLGGGIGTRGPGEKKLETDRRRIIKRIRKLERELRELAERREVTRRKRKEGKFLFSLAGYTNSGKSTLLKALSHREVFIKDQLFSTLDPLVKRVYLDGFGEVLVSDTVGFIRNLPHQLIEAFKSTLEEIVDSHCIIIVIDSTWEDVNLQIKEVMKVLEEIGAMQREKIFFFNKVDLLDEVHMRMVGRIKDSYASSILGSAMRGDGIKELKEKMLEVALRIKGEEERAHEAGS